MILLHLLFTSALTAATPSAPAAPPLTRQEQFAAACKSAAGSFFLTETGRIYGLRDGVLVPAAVLRGTDGRPYRWGHLPTGFVGWKGDWYIASLSDRLTRFHADGSFVEIIPLPVRVDRLTATNDTLWVVNMLAQSPNQQLWQSKDGHTFTMLPSSGAGDQRTFATPLDNLLIVAGSPNGDLYCTPAVGPPVMHRRWPPRRRTEIPIAYSRTRFRSELQEVAGMVDDVTVYSLPVRDVFPSGNGIVTLRNREDVVAATGKIENLVGRRADRYDDSGRHLATATFPISVNWIAAADGSGVTALDHDGRIIRAAWSAPIPGVILGK
jgi:hypothetical protein